MSVIHSFTQQTYVKYYVPDIVSSAKKINISKTGTLRLWAHSLFGELCTETVVVDYEKCYIGNIEDVLWMT